MTRRTTNSFRKDNKKNRNSTWCAIIVCSSLVGLLLYCFLKEPEKLSSGTLINGHTYVDLGLSVNWATTNIGAITPKDYGDYYAWGEDCPKKNYNWESYRPVKSNTLDIATNVWGNSWRLPTKSEIEELYKKCDWQWDIRDGNYGYTITGPNGNRIFLPASGYMNGTDLNRRDFYCYYWSGDKLYNENKAFSLSYEIKRNSYNSRRRYRGVRNSICGQGLYKGFSVRPVVDK